MTLWAIGIAVHVLVVVPIVVLILNRVLRPALEIKRYSEQIAAHGGLFEDHLDALGDLVRTRELVQDLGDDLERYGRALEGMR